MRESIEPALRTDVDGLRSLLAAVDLPTEGLDEHLGTALVARENGELVGCVALEPYGDAALLRSLAVVPSRRGRGLGRQLAHAALELGRAHGIRTVYLLTLTAAEFFSRHFGFRPLARAQVPASVRRSIEFVSACPTTAQAMVLEMPT